MNTGHRIWNRAAATVFTLLLLGGGAAGAAELTFFAFSDIHYGADDGGKKPPMTQSAKVPIINALPGTDYPPSMGGQVGVPKGILMEGDLINDGAVAQKYPTQWANYVADFGVNGEGRCKFPVFEGLGNHDANENLFVLNQIKERNLKRKELGYITNISSNGFHYSWDWEGVHFIMLNLFPGNVWEGEADAYGRGHNPQFARDFMVEDLQKNVGNSGRPVVVIHHFRPIDENWWTYAAADKYHRVLQDYNVIAIIVGHQGGGVNNTWRGYNWISSNGELTVCRIKDDTFSAVARSATAWGTPMTKKFFYSYAAAGLPAVVNNGDWATKVTATTATLSGKVVYEAAGPTEVTVYWGPTDAGTKAEGWANSKKLGVLRAGETGTVDISGLQPWTTNYYRCAARNAKGEAWAAVSVPFYTQGVLPSGWQAAFVGYEQRAGSGAHFDNGVFTLKGSGRDIGERGERNDDFEFAWQTLEGDGELKARIASAEAKTREPKIGIMMRESADDGAKNASVLLLPKGGVRISSRSKDKGASDTKTIANVKNAPCWVKLVRAGNTFSGFCSEDGQTWTAVGAPVTIEMPAKILAGLAVTSGSRDESKLNVSTFDQVTLTPAAK